MNVGLLNVVVWEADTYSGEWPFLEMSTLCFLFRTVFKYWKIKIKPHLWPLLGVCEFGFQKLAGHSQHVIPDVVLKGHLLRSDGKAGRWAASASDKARLSVSDS